MPRDPGALRGPRVSDQSPAPEFAVVHVADSDRWLIRREADGQHLLHLSFGDRESAANYVRFVLGGTYVTA